MECKIKVDWSSISNVSIVPDSWGEEGACHSLHRASSLSLVFLVFPFPLCLLCSPVCVCVCAMGVAPHCPSSLIAVQPTQMLRSTHLNSMYSAIFLTWFFIHSWPDCRLLSQSVFPASSLYLLLPCYLLLILFLLSLQPCMLCSSACSTTPCFCFEPARLSSPLSIFSAWLCPGFPPSQHNQLPTQFPPSSHSFCPALPRLTSHPFNPTKNYLLYLKSSLLTSLCLALGCLSLAITELKAKLFTYQSVHCMFQPSLMVMSFGWRSNQWDCRQTAKVSFLCTVVRLMLVSHLRILTQTQEGVLWKYFVHVWLEGFFCFPKTCNTVECALSKSHFAEWNRCVQSSSKICSD